MSGRVSGEAQAKNQLPTPFPLFQMRDVVQLSEPPLVLLAEDDRDDAFFMQRAFAHSGLPSRLFVVSSGVETLDYLQGKGPYADRQRYPIPGLLLLDLKMPLMGGFEVLEWLQGRSEFNRLPIVILSGSGLSEDVHRAEQLGADDYRVKSSDINHLTQMLHELHARWLNGHRKASRPLPYSPATSIGSGRRRD